MFRVISSGVVALLVSTSVDCRGSTKAGKYVDQFISDGLAGLCKSVSILKSETKQTLTSPIGDQRKDWHVLVVCRISFWEAQFSPPRVVHFDSLHAFDVYLKRLPLIVKL